MPTKNTYAMHKKTGEILLVLGHHHPDCTGTRLWAEVVPLAVARANRRTFRTMSERALLDSIVILPEKLLARLEHSLSSAKRQFFFSMHDHLYKDELFDKRPHWDDVRDGLLALMKQLERGLCDWCMMPAQDNECTSCGRQQEVENDD